MRINGSPRLLQGGAQTSDPTLYLNRRQAPRFLHPTQLFTHFIENIWFTPDVPPPTVIEWAIKVVRCPGNHQVLGTSAIQVLFQHSDD
jgi:hypothetical protein